ncbi:MAG TPA: universal stress protein [Baekduia sp.]|nr:universal stress protein [Baekduia sp.]
MASASARSDHPVVVCAHGADSSGAVQLGATLAAAAGQRLVLASAYRYEPVGLGASPLPSPLNEVRFDRAVAQIERAERLIPHGVKVDERPIPAEDVPEALVGLAVEVDACAIVLGRDLSGHVTRAVIERAPCPVAVSPFSVPLPEPEPLRAIGVAYDGSPAARCALAAAGHLAAAAAGGELRVIAVGGGIADAEAEAEPPSEEVEVEVERLEGDPRRLLVAESDSLDLLACGSRGRGRVTAAVLGSVSSHLVRAAHCPVLLVPPRVRPRPDRPLGLSTAAE